MAKRQNILWSRADLADAIDLGLREQARLDDLEQAVYGFDARDELGLHPLVRRALQSAGYGAWPEVTYPDHRGKARKSQGLRCDLVLTPAPDGQPLRDRDVKGTLFDASPAIDPEDAYWLEIKTVAQFEKEGPFRRYSAELFSPVPADVKKLWGDSLIRHSGLLLLLFTADQATAEHDLQVWHSRCLDKGYPLTTPAVRGLRLCDRIGNGWCSAALFGVRGG